MRKKDETKEEEIDTTTLIKHMAKTMAQTTHMQTTSMSTSQTSTTQVMHQPVVT
jgi:hypothetical protein